MAGAGTQSTSAPRPTACRCRCAGGAGRRAPPLPGGKACVAAGGRQADLNAAAPSWQGREHTKVYRVLLPGKSGGALQVRWPQWAARAVSQPAWPMCSNHKQCRFKPAEPGSSPPLSPTLQPSSNSRFFCGECGTHLWAQDPSWEQARAGGQRWELVPEPPAVLPACMQIYTGRLRPRGSSARGGRCPSDVPARLRALPSALDPAVDLPSGVGNRHRAAGAAPQRAHDAAGQGGLVRAAGGRGRGGTPGWVRLPAALLV